MKLAQLSLLIAVGSISASLALIYGVFAGRHDAVPAPQIIALKAFVERSLGLERQWRRDWSTDVSAAQSIECPNLATRPIVLLTGGQSNAGNALSDPVDADAAIPALMIFGGKCYALADPLLGPDGKRGSLWAKLGQDLSRATGQPVVTINVAVAATKYEDWLNTDTGYFARLERALGEAVAMGFSPDFVLWHQGESNAYSREPAEEMAKPLQTLVNRILTLPGLESSELILYRASICAGPRAKSNKELIAAQTLVAARTERVIPGPNTDDFDVRDRFDGCHFNGRGRDKIVSATLILLLERLSARAHALPKQEVSSDDGRYKH